MSAPKPPVALKNHCSVIHDGVLYVYSADAFQTLQISDGAKWKQLPNGISVTGAACVKGGVDGDNSKPALYVVGGSANASHSDYPGLQRYSILDETWQTITPVVTVTQNRTNHGAAYMNASSSILVYAGSQNAYRGASSETFLLEMYPPYRALAYSSTAPPTVKPFMLSWSEDEALMVGGTTTNVNVFTFGPATGWQDLGLTLPNPLPDHSVAQPALLTLDDGSKILQTFDLGVSPPTVTTNVLLNPGGAAASFNETVGASTTTATPTPTPFATSKLRRRSTSLDTFPQYNNSLAPSDTRTNFDLAQGDDGLVAFVGGNTNDPVVFYNQSANGWVAATSLLGKQSTPTTTQSAGSATSTSTPAASSSPGGKSHGLTILGAVLGSVCGLAAILIILLLWLRSVRRKRAHADKQNEYADDKRRSNEEERGLQPLSRAGQPMGRSPVPSTVITEADSTAMTGSRADPKFLIRRVSSDRAQPGFRGSGIGFGQALFKRDKPPLVISKPMMPVLGDYQERPSIELGKATPADPVAARAAPTRKASQRKTDEGWGKYFQAEPPSATKSSFDTGTRQTSRGNGSFWPGSGVPEGAARSSSTKPPRIILRDSVGNPLQAHSVAAGSPTLEHGPSNPQSKGLQAVQGIPARISSASSVTTSGTDDDDYEDDRFEGAFSSGVPASVHDHPWTPVGNTWSGPAQRPLRPPSSYIASQGQAPPAVSPNETDGSGSQSPSIPSFPMPNSLRTVRPSAEHAAGPGEPHEARDYFTHVRARSGSPPQNTDMSWLNLGTPR